MVRDSAHSMRGAVNGRSVNLASLDSTIRAFAPEHIYYVKSIFKSMNIVFMSENSTSKPMATVQTR